MQHTLRLPREQRNMGDSKRTTRGFSLHSNTTEGCHLQMTSPSCADTSSGVPRPWLWELQLKKWMPPGSSRLWPLNTMKWKMIVRASEMGSPQPKSVQTKMSQKQMYSHQGSRYGPQSSHSFWKQRCGHVSAYPGRQKIPTKMDQAPFILLDAGTEYSQASQWLVFCCFHF